MHAHPLTAAFVVAAAVIACDFLPPPPNAQHDLTRADTICTGPVTAGALPPFLAETSGAALGSHGRLWTHNDGADGILYALDANGRVTQRVRVEGVQLDDWEDLASGTCDGGRCLYIADIGDNDGNRAAIAIHIVREPAPHDSTVRPHTTLNAAYPDGAQDAEGVLTMPNGNIFIVTKGRHRAVGLYRVPDGQQAAPVSTLQPVRTLAPRPADPLDRFSAATATPDGRWIALRTYRSLLLFPTRALVANEPVEPRRVDLVPLRQPQSEAIALANDGTLWLTTERDRGRSAMWARLQCSLP